MSGRHGDSRGEYFGDAASSCCGMRTAGGCNDRGVKHGVPTSTAAASAPTVLASTSAAQLGKPRGVTEPSSGGAVGAAPMCASSIRKQQHCAQSASRLPAHLCGHGGHACRRSNEGCCRGTAAHATGEVGAPLRLQLQPLQRSTLSLQGPRCARCHASHHPALHQGWCASLPPRSAPLAHRPL